MQAATSLRLQSRVAGTAVCSSQLKQRGHGTNANTARSTTHGMLIENASHQLRTDVSCPLAT